MPRGLPSRRERTDLRPERDAAAPLSRVARVAPFTRIVPRGDAFARVDAELGERAPRSEPRRERDAREPGRERRHERGTAR